MRKTNIIYRAVFRYKNTVCFYLFPSIEYMSMDASLLLTLVMSYLAFHWNKYKLIIGPP